jgi:hypothetical protein
MCTPQVGQGDQVVAALPYQFKVDATAEDAWGGGLQVSYGPLRRTSTPTALIDWFGVDLCLRAVEPVASHSVVRHDALTVDVAFGFAEASADDLEDAAGAAAHDDDENDSVLPASTTPATLGLKRFTATLARGSPYATALYQGGALPVVASSRPLLAWEAVSAQDVKGAGLDLAGVSAFRATYDNTGAPALGENRGPATVTWLLFFQGSHVELSASADGASLRVVPSTFAGGVVRAALVPPRLHGGSADPRSGFPADFPGGGGGGAEGGASAAEAVLLQHAVAWPSGGSVEWDLNPPPPPPRVGGSTPGTFPLGKGYAGSALQEGFAAAFEGQPSNHPTAAPAPASATAAPAPATAVDTATYSFAWRVRRMGDASPAAAPPPLLAMALPHHAQTLELANPAALALDQEAGEGDAQQPARLGSAVREKHLFAFARAPPSDSIRTSLYTRLATPSLFFSFLFFSFRFFFFFCCFCFFFFFFFSLSRFSVCGVAPLLRRRLRTRP